MRKMEPVISLPATITSGVYKLRASLFNVNAPPQIADSKISRNQLVLNKFMLVLLIKFYENSVYKYF